MFLMNFGYQNTYLLTSHLQLVLVKILPHSHLLIRLILIHLHLLLRKGLIDTLHYSLSLNTSSSGITFKKV